MFNSISGAGSPRSGAATPPFGAGAGTPPLGPEQMMSAMGSQQMDRSIGLVPQLSNPRGLSPNAFASDGFAASALAYGPGGWASAASPIDRSADLTNTGTSLGSPMDALPPGAMPPGTRFPASMPPMAGPMLPMGSVPPGSRSMPPLTVPPPMMMAPPGAPGMGGLPSGPFGPPMLPPTSGAAGPPGTSPLGSGPFQGPGTMSDVGSMGGFGKDFTLVVTRLLDMPESKTFFGKTKGFKVRVFDDEDREVAATRELPPERGAEADGIQLREQEGSVRVRTRSQLLFVQVEHVGVAGVMGNDVIGRCQIHRMDPRSSQIWPYALSDPDGSPANCGVELKVVENLPPAGGSQAFLPGSSQSPFTTTMPGKAQSSMMSGSSKRPGWTLEEGAPMAGMQDMNHGVSALLEFDKVTDLPYPSDDAAEQLMIMVMDEEKNRELRRVGPFVAKDQRGGYSNRLVMADCQHARVFARAPLHFGGSAEEGAMFVKVGVSYLRGTSDTELIGATDPIKVSWRPAEKKYYEIRQSNTRKVIGGIYLTHRLMTEGEMAGGSASAADLGAQNRRRQQPKIGAPAEGHLRVSGRTNNFPAGSPEEAFEQAAINCEAQNRALLQRCKMTDANSGEDELHVRTVNGYREWDNLDSLFSSMGPNPLAHSEDLGPSVARSYCETTNMLKELVPKFGPTGSVADEQLNLRLVHMMYGEDPWKVTQTLRPVMCKDPKEIAATRDMQWCPDPPVYAPLRNMSEQDKETMRLACFDPRQNAKLMFVDANPNYRIDEDVWGVLSDYKSARSLIVPKPETAHRRVKDDCIMS